MKNFNQGKSTIIGTIEEGALFEKARGYVGKYDKGQINILGYLKTKSTNFPGTFNYSLYVEFADRKFLMNVPSAYGEALESDFLASDQTAEEYFGGASIKEIRQFTTKFNTTSFDISIYEN